MSVFTRDRVSKYTYNCSLVDVFSALGDKTFTPSESVSLLNNKGILIHRRELEEFIDYKADDCNLKPSTLPFTFTGPFQMKSVLDSHFLFNLEYQDKVIKTEVEKSEIATDRPRKGKERNALIRQILTLVAVVLRTAFASSDEPLFLSLTNAELDYIVTKCLSHLGGCQVPEDLVRTGKTANRISHLVQERILSETAPGLEELVALEIYSGVIWWSDSEIQERFIGNSDGTILFLKKQLEELNTQSPVLNDFERLCLSNEKVPI